MPNKFPQVSVVIPMFNSGSTAIAAINSVIYQSYPASEIIIINDGSTDNSLELISSRFDFTKNKISVYTASNNGVASARNLGISYAKYEYIAFLDSDDVWLPAKLEIQISLLESMDHVFLVGSLTSMGNNRYAQLGKSDTFSYVNLRMLLFKNYFQTSTVVIRSSLINSIGPFPDGRKYAEEGDFFMRIAANYTCILLNTILVDYSGGKSGFGSSGLSSKILEMELGELGNIYNVFRRHDASLFICTMAAFFSILKFFRRFFLTFLFKLNHIS